MKVAFIDTVHPILWEMLESKGFNCVDYTTIPSAELTRHFSDVEGIVIRSRIKLFKEQIDQAPQLQFIARSGSGLENIDVAYAKSKGIKVYNSPEGNRDAVGEQAIGMLLSLFNKINTADQEVRKGHWNREDNRGAELAGKTVGLIGYGVMGKAMAKKLSGFDCKIIAYDKYKEKYGDQYAQEVDLKTLFRETDILSLHTNLLPENTGLINAELLSKFEKSIYVINTARGQSLVVEDLLDAIDSGKVLGACLDVLEYEKYSFESLHHDEMPESFDRLAKCEKVILSPHVAGWTVESYRKLSTFLGEKIILEFSS